MNLVNPSVLIQKYVLTHFFKNVHLKKMLGFPHHL